MRGKCSDTTVLLSQGCCLDGRTSAFRCVLSFFIMTVFLVLQLLETLLPLSDLTARVNSAVDLIMSTDSSINRDSLHFAASTFYYKLKAADGYAPTTKYQGDVLLLRAKLSSNYEQNLGDDYKLKEVLHNVLDAVTVK